MNKIPNRVCRSYFPVMLKKRSEWGKQMLICLSIENLMQYRYFKEFFVVEHS